MKKLALTIAVVLGMSFGAFAQGSGLFDKGPDRNVENNNKAGILDLGLPAHGETSDQDAVPVGTGALLLIGFGAAYALKKNNEK